MATNTEKQDIKTQETSLFLKNIMTMVSGNTIAYIIPVILSPLIARLFSPEEFGLFGLYTSIVAIFSVASSLKYELAIMLPEKERNAHSLIVLSLILTLLTSFLVFAGLWFFKGFLINHINSKIESFIFLIPLGVLLAGLSRIFVYWNIRLINYKNVVRSRISGAVTAGAVKIISKTLLIFPNGLIIGQLIGSLSSVILLLSGEVKKNILTFKEITIEGIIANLKEYKNFPKYQSFSVIFNSISQNIPNILLLILFSPAVAGFYALTSRVLVLPSSFIGKSVREVYYQEASAIFNRGESIKEIFLKTTLGLIKVYSLPCLVILFFAPWLFSVIFGKEWVVAGIFAQINVLWLFLGLINVPAVMTTYILQMQKFNMIWEGSLLVLRFSSIYFSYLIFNDYFIAVGVYALTGIIANAFLILYVYKKIKKI